MVLDPRAKPLSPRPARGTHHPDLKAAIKESAWKEIAETGASSLSLRAIARDLGITAPAIYNYFADRDALVTELIVDAYTSFGDWQIEARDAAAAMDIKPLYEAIGIAYREWAVAFPQRYLLNFGTPIPGYRMHQDEVRPAGAHPLSLSVALHIWARVHGLVSLEISGHIPPFGPKGDALYHQELRMIGEQFILPAAAPKGKNRKAIAKETGKRNSK